MEQEMPEEKDWRQLEPNYGVKILLTILYSLILVTGIVGNSATIRATQVLRRNGYLQRNVTDHMVSLACSDLLVLLVGMPVELYSAIWFPFTSASGGDAACKVYNFIFEACSYATILNVATLSFERYVAICHPFRFRSLSGRRTSGLVALAWLVSVLVALPLLVATGTQGHIPVLADEPVQNLTFCTNLRERWLMYRVSIFLAFLVYLLVLAGVAFMCRAMILVLRKSGGSSGRAGERNHKTVKHESTKMKMARKQTIIFLGLIVGSLFVCWFPNQIRRLMMAGAPKSRWTTAYFRSYVTLHPVADTFFYLSSALNPFLYNVSSRQFRQVFIQVLRCRLAVQHVNKRTVPSSRDQSARSLQPLLFKSLRRSKGVDFGVAEEAKSQKQSDAEVNAGPTKEALDPTTQTDVQSGMEP
ncbi:G-protein coupled receptor 39 [Corythoichthys intestinalis]|uniref:G-protein coupled receptor 39 n=1 Tax=Corythoichthys intestinalis TaxID=161448 RepID=UPI0025A5973A|nr:G-protein coupled receptor 39 [Corythoichthys intestinalis]XP_061799754.1 G-protein coupled receptor 39-like [Nerophis lumbriciformis]